MLLQIFRRYSYHVYELEFNHIEQLEVTKNNNLVFFRFIKEDFNLDELEKVKAQHIKAYFLYLKKLGRKASYVNGIMGNMRSFFRETWSKPRFQGQKSEGHLFI